MTDYPFTNVVGGQDWDQSFAGAGALDGLAQTVKSIQDGDGWSVGANALSAGIDLLGFVDNPVKALGTTAIGWLIEHLTALDIFLDRTTGDPQAVQNAAETFYQAAKNLDQAAADQIRSFGTEVQTYRSGQSPSAVSFEQRVGPRGDELKALSLQCFGLGEAMNKAGLLVASCRGLIRDLLTEFTWWVFKKGVIALAAAPYTGGGSLAALLTDTCIAGAKLAKKFTDKLSVLADDLNTLRGLMQELARNLGEPLNHAIALSLGKNFVPSAAKTVDDSVSLTAADAAEQQVAEQEAAERRADADPPLMPPEPVTPLPSPPKKQGPGLGARWTTTGTLDE